MLASANFGELVFGEARRGEDRIVFNHEDSGKFPPKREKGEFR